MVAITILGTRVRVKKVCSIVIWLFLPYSIGTVMLLVRQHFTQKFLLLRYSSTLPNDAHKQRLRLWREALINRTTNREISDLQSLLYEFSKNNVELMLEEELSEFDTVLRLDDEALTRLISRPGAQEERHKLLQNNFTLDRFLNFARFKSGTGEYR